MEESAFVFEDGVGTDTDRDIFATSANDGVAPAATAEKPAIPEDVVER
jgi:hypothetical protein